LGLNRIQTQITLYAFTQKSAYRVGQTLSAKKHMNRNVNEDVLKEHLIRMRVLFTHTTAAGSF
jgi:hypothetical protein